MKKDIISFVFLLASVHQSLCVGSPITYPPLPPPADSPVSTSMAAFSPGIQLQEGELHKMVAHKRLFIALITASASLGTILFCSLLFWAYHRKYSLNSKKNNPKSSDAEKGMVLWPFSRKFSSARTYSKASSNKGNASFIEYKILEKGTGSFEDSNILGQGGFGCVYRTRFENNTLAAVKKLDCSKEEAEREFQNEVDLLSKIQHPNVISLLGYSSDGDARFIVYELMHNGSLETQLHGLSRGSALTWHMRMKIALDMARGLEYLHEHCNPPVIHRDLKSSNILLDYNFNAKLSDFGLAVTDGSQNKNLKLSGTVGYVAPEYLLDGQLTDKSDVYAFGVVLLELLLGRRPVEKLAPTECQSVVTWAMPHLTDRNKLPTIIDPVIKDSMDLKHLYQVAAVAVLCVQAEPSYRPLITDVLHSLIPLVPMELGGTLRLPPPPPPPPKDL